jgi:hypothetical protein
MALGCLSIKIGRCCDGLKRIGQCSKSIALNLLLVLVTPLPYATPTVTSPQ